MVKSSREVSDLPLPVNLKDEFGSSSLVAQMVKNTPAVWETGVRSLDWEEPLEGGHGNPLQYSCLENLHGQRGWQAPILGVAESDTLSD